MEKLVDKPDGLNSVSWTFIVEGRTDISNMPNELHTNNEKQSTNKQINKFEKYHDMEEKQNEHNV
jgi:5S rRNA maturation endonuclease (ribonuclease M5)